MAIYQPEEGMALAQMNTKKKGREITCAPTLLRQIDLRGVMVSGDAMFDRRSLSQMIVQADGDYLWTVKEMKKERNEKGLYQDIELLFQPYRKLAGTSAPPLRCLTILRSGSLQDKGKQIWPTPDGKFAYHLDTSLTRLVA